MGLCGVNFCPTLQCCLWDLKPNVKCKCSYRVAKNICCVDSVFVDFSWGDAVFVDFLQYCGVQSLIEYHSILLPLAALTQVQTTYFAQPYGIFFFYWRVFLFLGLLFL